MHWGALQARRGVRYSIVCSELYTGSCLSVTLWVEVDRANGRRKFATQQPSLRDSTMSMARLRTADRVRRVRDVCAACDSCGLRLSLSLDRGRPTAAARGSSHRVRARYGFYIKM